MLGAIISDIVGSRFEFNPTNNYNFELFGEGCSFTDDTVCTIAIADALLQGSDYGESLLRWGRKFPHPMGGYGARFRQWLNSNDPKPYGSLGNGSAMRVSPVAWFCDYGDVCDEAKKSAECTHNHQEGIEGAIAVAMAIADCRELALHTKKEDLTPDKILYGGLDHATYMYVQFPQQFKVDLEEHRNRFDVTCAGTVPVALQIILESNGFEDALRRAVSLGADADTLGAIVGSIAEALWGIPEWIKQKALTYLPDDMLEVVNKFHRSVGRLRSLTRRCEYYKVDEFKYTPEKHQAARAIEKEWAHDLARSYRNADTMKALMAKRCEMEHWQQWAEEYDLPLSLVGYIFKHTADCGMMMHECVDPFLCFLREHYSERKANALKAKAERQQADEMAALMLWKLGLGNMGKLFNGEDPMPPKKIIATKDSWKTEQMPSNPDLVSECDVEWLVAPADMAILRRGHIPEAMEDHWFMYATSNCIRYFRSWTGICAYEAFYRKLQTGNFLIYKVRINRALCNFGVNGDMPALAMLQYLIASETGSHSSSAWNHYLDIHQATARKHSPQ